MPLFRYKAVDPAGATVHGELEAPQAAQVLELLRGRGLLPVRVDPARVARGPARPASMAIFSRRTLSGDDQLEMTRELATLLRSGITLDRSLEILVGLAASEPVRALLQRVREDVRGGASFSQALDRQAGVFSRFYVNIVRAGEAGGALPLVLSRLAEFMERGKELRETVRSALVYPIILVVVAVASVMLLMVYVIPQFEQMFNDAGRALPTATQVVIAVGHFVQRWWWTLIALAALLVLVARRELEQPHTRVRWHARFLRLPLVGDLIAKLETARFARTLGTLLSNGVPLLSGITIVRETMGNDVLARALDGVVVKLREGRGLSQPMLETGVFPPLALHMMKVGEETGQLPEMLQRVADVYDREVQTAVRRMLSLLEPALIILMAIVVAAIILSILVGILSINDLAI